MGARVRYREKEFYFVTEESYVVVRNVVRETKCWVNMEEQKIYDGEDQG